MQPFPARLAIGAALAAFLGPSCHASVQGDAKADVSGVSGERTDAELDAEIQKERATGVPAGLASGSVATASDAPLLGARHDLTLMPAQAPMVCACLKVGLGPPTHPAFRWKGTPPTVNPGTQLVIGLSSEGMTCTEPKGSLGASYWGYRQLGKDVVVFVESAIKGRPLTTGAVIPKPFDDGKVYVAPAFQKEPYGRGNKGEARCELGNPGPPRLAAPAPAEPAETPADAG